METQNIKSLVQRIVKEAKALKDKHTDQKDASVNYACIFSHNKQEYNALMGVTKKIGQVIEKTPTGLLFQIQPLETNSGKLNNP